MCGKGLNKVKLIVLQNSQFIILKLSSLCSCYGVLDALQVFIACFQNANLMNLPVKIQIASNYINDVMELDTVKTDRMNGIVVCFFLSLFIYLVFE